MEYREAINKAAEVLGITVEEANQNCMYMDTLKSVYVWNSARGGQSVILNKNGEKLVATSGLSFKRHLQDFQNGVRN